MNYEAREVESLATKIMRYKIRYYEGKPEISDPEYDALEEELRRLAPAHPVLDFVGSDPDAHSRKVEHDVAMLSLGKTYDLDELKSWVKERPVVGMLKIDGASLSLVYRMGRLDLAKTRGNGRVGEDVTVKARWVADVVPELKDKIDVEIRGELFCSATHFATLSEELVALGVDRPTSPRNIVAGLLGRKNHYNLARYFSFYAFEVLSDEIGFAAETEKFEWLNDQSFSLPQQALLKNFAAIEDYLEQVKKVMEEDEIGCDGAVFSYDDIALHQELGSTSHHPRYKMSFKWQGATANAKIERISWSTSRLGLVTPVAVIEPVFLSGAQITNITLHNAAHVIAYNLKAGDEIEIVRSGEVIPKFLQIVKKSKGQHELPKRCPECSTTLEFDDVRLKCPNELDCPAQQSGVILNWIRCVEIDDLSEKRLGQMMDIGLVASVPDLYKLEKADFLKLPQTKDKMAAKLFGNIQASKNLPLARFLNGLGIQGAGLTTWEKLLENFQTLKKLQKASAEQIASVDGFADKSAQQIVEGLEARQSLIDELLAVGVKPKHDASGPARAGALSGKQVVITGALSRPRKEVENLIKAAGGKLSSSVSKNTAAVVSNDADSSSSKMKKARELGLPIWTEDDLLKMLN